MDKVFSKKFLKFGLVFLGGLIVGAGALYGSFHFGLYVPLEAGDTTPDIVNGDKEAVLEADLSILWDVIRIIKDKHFRIEDIEDKDLLYGAIAGVVGALNDPYSSFFNPSDAKKFSEDINGSFGGIGAEISIRKNQLLIVAPLKGNPAEAVGLQAGDKILKVDDTFTNNLTIEGAVKIIRGEVGTEVILLILRDDWVKAKEFNITRAVIVVPTLDWEMVSDDIAYLRLYNFNSSAPQLFYQASFSVLLKGTQGVILDLRNNSGGFLEVANNIASWFLERGDVIVREKFRSGDEKLFRGSGPNAFLKMPVIVLVNGGSASASEIVAGALRDNRGIKLVGEKTFGKGTVQEVETLRDGSSIKVSVAEWLTPAGHKIDNVGLEPDVEVKLTEEDVENGLDPQFDKALEILRAEIVSSNRRTIFINL